jgi:hypothetical protein
MKDAIIADLEQACVSEILFDISLFVEHSEKIHCEKFYRGALVGKVDAEKEMVTLYVKGNLPENTRLKRIEPIQRICKVTPV